MGLRAPVWARPRRGWNLSCLNPKRVADEIAGNRRAERGEQGGKHVSDYVAERGSGRNSGTEIVARRDRHHRGRMGQRSAPPKA